MLSDKRRDLASHGVLSSNSDSPIRRRAAAPHPAGGYSPMDSARTGVCRCAARSAFRQRGRPGLLRHRRETPETACELAYQMFGQCEGAGSHDVESKVAPHVWIRAGARLAHQESRPGGLVRGGCARIEWISRQGNLAVTFAGLARHGRPAELCRAAQPHGAGA
jgi:hypothetical protein